ncbi:MAG TPA: hypothetical protein VI076_01425, partial [Actinopolymorphaceae bacterium]
GRVVGRRWSDRTAVRPSPRTLRVSATAPAKATKAALVVETNGEARIDDALISARLTDTGPQISVDAQANGTTYGVDEQGRDIAYTVVAGGTGSNGRLVGIDVVTAEITLDIPIPGATGAWGAATAPDGTVYLGTYSNGHLYSYRAGDDAVTDLGQPVSGITYAYAVTAASDGSVYGGTYPTATVWKYTPGEGFTTLGPDPISPGQEYIRSIAIDEGLGLLYAGTGTTARIVAVPLDGRGEATQILPESYQTLPWTYNLVAAGGQVLARVTQGDHSDHLVHLEVSRAGDGSITTEVVKDLPDVSYPGASNIVDGAAYYTKTRKLFRYDLASRTETDLDVDTGIWARTWIVKRLADQEAYPGFTLVGTNSGGIVARYHLGTGRFETNQVDALPRVDTDLESMVCGPDGKVYTSGGFGGGIGIYTPMRADQQVSHSGQKGFFQAEGWTVLGDRIFQGVYPDARIQSFTPEEAASGVTPRLHCTVQGQDRPYGMLAVEGRIYAGTMPAYGGTAGALVVLDPALADGETDEVQVYENIVPNQSLVSLAYSRGKVLGGSLVWANYGTPPTEPEAKLLVFAPDTAQSRVLDLPVRGLRSITAMVVGPDGLVWMLAQNHLLAYDPDGDRWTHARNAFPDLEYGDDRIDAYDSQLVATPDGHAYGVIRGRLFRLDLASGAVTELYRGGISRIGVDGYGNVYTRYAGSRLLRYVPR